MIRLLYMSDLHIEMEHWRLSPRGLRDAWHRWRHLPGHPLSGPLLAHEGKVDLVVLAGDIHVGMKVTRYASEVAKYLGVPVVLVAGNHEYYGQPMMLLEPAFFGWADFSAGRGAFLENSVASYTIRDERLHVLGCTLWTDYSLNGDADEAMAFAERRMNDHRLIHRVSSLFRPKDALEHHEKSRAWLHVTAAALRRYDPEAKIVVVTHHAPSVAFLGNRDGKIAPAYATELLEEFADYRIDAWVHGHTHYRHESVVEGIKVVSAPRGYVRHSRSAALAYVPGVLEL